MQCMINIKTIDKISGGSSRFLNFATPLKTTNYLYIFFFGDCFLDIFLVSEIDLEILEC